MDDSSLTLPLSSLKSDSAAASSANSTPPPVSGLGKHDNQSQDNQVLNETLNVINEHITDLRSPASNGALRAPPTDSGSEYSAPLDHRMSYIQGEETDEEEDSAAHSRSEVEAWSPDDVAGQLFTAGVEKHHCDVFREQEISGEVLLGMDQSSLFIKAFDLGSVGRRLKTWHKIKALQDEVDSHAAKRTTQTYAGDAGVDDAKRTRSRNNTLTNSASVRPMSAQARRVSSSQTPRLSPTALNSPVSPASVQDSPTRPSHAKRPSAASVRQLHHSRRHSSTDFRTTLAASGIVPALNTNGASTAVDGAHRKQPSFDRNWTLGGALSAKLSPRPLSSAGLTDAAPGPNLDALQDSAVDLDRGYFSGTDADGRKRNVLRKRDSTSHSRQSSYAEEQRVRSATALTRHSRFGSVDSFRDGPPPSAAQKYYGVQPTGRRRTASTTTTDSMRPVPPAKDTPPPAVTNLEARNMSGRQGSPTAPKHPAFNSDWLSSMVSRPMGKRPGMRAISDRLTHRSKDMDAPELPPKDASLDSPAPTGSSTPSGGPSFELDSPGVGKNGMAVAPASKAARRKGKKETSAYTRGLQKVAPLEAKQDADYYGWMKKKSSNLMTTWKPRLFVLKGRRLAYYYAEDDGEEKGLIDISFHRVLPADNEKLTGLHATITGMGGPGLPYAMGGDNAGLDKGDDSTFIFKLVPPRAGLSRAVNFTKPTVHYFAVPNLQQGRLWMAALMKATIDRDDSQPITTTYQQKTISLAKAKQMRHRPPALMNLEEANEDEHKAQNTAKPGNLGESDSGVSGVDKLASAAKADGSDAAADDASEKPSPVPPQSA